MDLNEIFQQFSTNDEFLGFSTLGNGHINTTFLITTKKGTKYVLQIINNQVFNNIDVLMENTYKVTEYLHRCGFETLQIIKTKDNQLYYIDNGVYYRLLTYIKDAICYETIDNILMVYYDGLAFGKLHKALFNFDSNQLGEVILDFHNTPKRYLDFLDALKKAPQERIEKCKEEIQDIESFKEKYSIIVDGIKTGEISHVVTHNDPKINNVLFDKFSGNIRAVIDLDTVMPGSYLYDFGDSLRSLFTGDNEDNPNLDTINVHNDIFEAYVKGYLTEMASVLTPKEIELLPFSIFLLSIELGMRFLEDYLRGDIYFKTSIKDHNLIRARTQIHLAKEVLKHENELLNIVSNINKSISKDVVIGIDVGGTSIKGGFVTNNGVLLEKFSIDVVKDEPQEKTVDKIIDMVNKAIIDSGYNKDNIVGIGCGVPGLIDTNAGVVTYASNLGWNELPLKALLEKGIGLPVRLTNDANAAALAEFKFGVGKKYKSFLMVTLGTGIGSGIISNGMLHEGNFGKGAEFGHSLLVMGGRKCSCGRRGCLEAYASATALTKDTEEMMNKHKDSLMWECLKKYGKVNAQIPFDAAKVGDKYASILIKKYVKYLGEGLINYFNTFRPEAVILSGGIAEQGEFLISKIRDYCESNNYVFKKAPKVDIIKSTIGYDSGKIGAAALFMK